MHRLAINLQTCPSFIFPTQIRHTFLLRKRPVCRGQYGWLAHIWLLTYLKIPGLHNLKLLAYIDPSHLLFCLAARSGFISQCSGKSEGTVESGHVCFLPKPGRKEIKAFKGKVYKNKSLWLKAPDFLWLPTYWDAHTTSYPKKKKRKKRIPPSLRTDILTSLPMKTGGG